MTSDASDRVRHLLRSFEERARQVTELGQRLSGVRGVATSSGGVVTATVTPSGALVDLRLSPAAAGRNHVALQQEILQTVRAATRDAAGRLEEMVDPVLGADAQRVREAVSSAGDVPASRTDEGPPPAPRGDPADTPSDDPPETFLR
ncbi:YbaB/EbfC family nucleoid-associated protein [Actinoalloteichus spitiensis]|uniref:YbaB/EbfC family nucleoid-associated protein n=1 Tax=Actinoalloteichus spitiensis TaxID=252394 RepID=UPI00036D3865|nr:YbaB/EbfC family nucleoid-associated protein [Actinoalloteichus spitiensis]